MKTINARAMMEGAILAALTAIMMGILPYIGMLDIASDIRRKDRNIPGGAR
jgi:hypothetical protein